MHWQLLVNRLQTVCGLLLIYADQNNKGKLRLQGIAPMYGSVGAPVWPVVKIGRWWIHFTVIVVRATATFQQESEMPDYHQIRSEFRLAETDPAFHYWQYTLLIQCFLLPFGPITSTVNVIRYLHTSGVAQAIQLLQNGSSMRLFAKQFRGIPKCYVLCLAVISRHRPVLWESWTRAQKGQDTSTGQVYRLSGRWFRRSSARALKIDLPRGTEVIAQTVRNWLHSSE